mgnify:CR=1 FL=1
MQSINGQLLEFSFGLIESVLFFNFFSSIFTKKNNNDKKYLLCIAIYAIAIYISTNMSYFTNMKLVFNITVLIALVMILYEGTLKNKFIIIIIATIVMILSDIVTVNIITMLMKINIQEVIFEQSAYRIFMVCVSKLLSFITLKTISYYINKKNLDIPLIYWYMLMSIFVVLFTILISIGKIGAIIEQYFSESLYLIICSVGILIITMLINYIFIKLSKYYQKEQDYKIIELKNEFLEQCYLEQQEFHNKTSKLRHDFKNHNICILSLLKDNRIEEAKKYVDSMNDVITFDSKYIKTGNDIIDIVLNQKSALAEKNNINMKIDSNIPKDINMEPMDLLSILSNILDNAIEAVIKVNKDIERKINIKISKYKEYLFICISNTSEKDPRNIIKKSETTKKDKANHGLGSKIVKGITEKYNGSIEYSYENNLFTIKILVNIF